MKVTKALKFAAWAVILLPGTAILVTLAFFIHALTYAAPVEEADVIVVFQGRRNRAKAAYELIKRGVAPVLVISPASRQKLRAYDRMYQPERSFKRIIERRARTTFENALFTAKILDQHHFKSVIVITDWNHMPRAYIMLKLMQMGTGTQIHPYRLPTAHFRADNWYRYNVGWKMVYNEMVETFGSLLEWAWYRSTGRLLPAQPGKSSFFTILKQLLLFKIHLRPT